MARKKGGLTGANLSGDSDEKSDMHTKDETRSRITNVALGALAAVTLGVNAEAAMQGKELPYVGDVAAVAAAEHLLKKKGEFND